MDDRPRKPDEDLDRVFAAVRHLRHESGPVALGGEYLRAVECSEALPQNAGGADKTWVVETICRSRRQAANAVRVR